METIKGTVRLPVWLKMFANNEREDTAATVDHRLLEQIATALDENKTVTLLVNDKPVRISKEGGQIRVLPYESVKYVLK